MSRRAGGSPSSGGASRRSHEHDPLVDEEDLCMPHSNDVKYRRADVSHGIQGFMSGGGNLEREMPKDNPLYSGDSSGEFVSGWPGSRSPVHKRAQSMEYFKKEPDFHELKAKKSPYQWREGPGSSSPPSPPMRKVEDYDGEEPMLFHSPFSAASTVGPADAVEGDVRLMQFPRTFRLERTNFLLKWVQSSRPLISTVLCTLRRIFDAVKLDVVKFRGGDCVHECTYHEGNLFMGVWIRMFLPPDPSSGLLYSTEKSARNDEQNAFLVEAQLREGDKLHFNALFRDLLEMFNAQPDGFSVGGTYKYQTRSPPASGEGLCLTEVTSRSTRQNPHTCSRWMMDSRGRDRSPRDTVDSMKPLQTTPESSSRLEDVQDSEDNENLDEDAAADIMILVDMLRGTYLDVQIDAATGLAGITADGSTLRWLSKDSTAEVATSLYSAVWTLLINDCPKGVLRQISVVAANLTASKELCKRLFATEEDTSRSKAILERWASIVLGHESTTHQPSRKTSESEIGTRRECMRALLNVAKYVSELKDLMKSLLLREAAGRGATDRVLQKRLEEYRSLLSEA